MANPRALKTASVSGLLALAGLQFSRASDANLARLHEPGSESAGYGWLANSHLVRSAFGIWAHGATFLDDFKPRAVTWLVGFHVIGNSMFVIAAIITLAALIYLPPPPDTSLLPRAENRLVRLAKRPYGALFIAAGVLSLLAGGGALWSAYCASCRDTLATAMYWVTLFARLLLAVSVILFVAGYRKRIARFFGYVFRCTAALRITLVFAAFFVLALYGGRIGVQSEDLVERWFAGNPLQLLWAVLAYAVFVFVVASSKWSEARTRTPQPARLFVFALFATVGGIVIWRTDWGGRGTGLLVIGLIVLVLSLLELVLHNLLPATQPADDRDGGGVRIAVAAIPGVAIALLLVRTAANHLAVSEIWIPFLLLACGLIAFPIAGLAAWWGSYALSARVTSHRVQVVVAVAVAAGALGIMVFANVYADYFGAFSALLTLLAAIAAVAFAIRAWVHSTTVPRTIGVVGFQRTPAVTLLVAWLVITGMVNGAGNPRSSTDRITFEDVRTLPLASGGHDPAVSTDCMDRTQNVPSPTKVRDALCQWVAAAGATYSGKTIPLVLVTASGGGVRAAAWTEQVLDCLFFRANARRCNGTPKPSSDRWPLLFAANGASGGSVGIASTVAERLANKSTVPPASKTEPSWYRKQLGRDALSPVLGSAILHDGVLSTLGIFAGRDRTAVLEDEWSRTWAREKAAYCDKPAADDEIGRLGFITLARRCGKPLPRMLFNATDVDTGRRVNVAAVDFARRTAGEKNSADDLPPRNGPFNFGDYLKTCQDVSLFTAAFLSARFPLVSSDGRLPSSHGASRQGTKCESRTSADTRATRVLNIVDGGYSENSGSAQVGELWAQLSPLITAYNSGNPGPHIRPVLVEIENGERAAKKTLHLATGTGEFFRPLQAITNAVLNGRASPLDSFAGDFRLCTDPEQAAPTPGSDRKDENKKDQSQTDDAPLHLQFAMYEHPGELLPLGWTLSEHSLDDIRRQYGLKANKIQADCFDAAMQ